MTKEDKFKKLKEPFYHGTSCNLIDDIKEYGLARTHAERVHVESIGKIGVFVSKNIETALLYAYDASKECPPYLLSCCDADPSLMCIIKINKIPKRLKVVPDGYGDYVIKGDVPPHCRCFDIMRPKELKKKFKVKNLLNAVF